MVSASDTGHLVFVEQLLDEALGLGVELHEDDVGSVDRQLKGRLPPGDVLVEEELERKELVSSSADSLVALKLALEGCCLGMETAWPFGRSLTESD